MVDGEVCASVHLAENMVGETRALTFADRHAAGQVGKAEIGFAVAAVIGPQQGKYGCILLNRQQLPLRKGADRKVEGVGAHHAESLAQAAGNAASRGKDARKRKRFVEDERGLVIVVWYGRHDEDPCRCFVVLNGVVVLAVILRASEVMRSAGKMQGACLARRRDLGGRQGDGIALIARRPVCGRTPWSRMSGKVPLACIKPGRPLTAVAFEPSAIAAGWPQICNKFTSIAVAPARQGRQIDTLLTKP